jgi:hypothetical protein
MPAALLSPYLLIRILLVAGVGAFIVPQLKASISVLGAGK